MAPQFTDQDFKLSSLNLILGRVTLKRLPIFTRLELTGLNFNLVENQTDHTLFDALSLALTGFQSKENVHEIHSVVVDYITTEQWDAYKSSVKVLLEKQYSKAEEMHSNKSWTPSELQDHKEIYRAYSQNKFTQNRGSIFELCAAAEKFRFTFGIVVFDPHQAAIVRAVEEEIKPEFVKVHPGDFALHVYNCENPKIVDHASVKYYFLQSSDRDGIWEWHYLEPTGGLLYEIPNGIYSPNFKRVVTIHGNMLSHAKSPAAPVQNPSNLVQGIARLSNPKPRLRNRLPLSFPIVLDHNGREFCYRQTAYDDFTLFSILNHCLFDAQTDRRLETRLVIYVKRDEIGQFVEPVSERNVTLQPKNGAENLNMCYLKHFNVGDVHDLDIASSIFAFSYELFLLDSNMNWCYERKKCPEGAKTEVWGSRPNVHLVLFARVNVKKHNIRWYRLEGRMTGPGDADSDSAPISSESESFMATETSGTTETGPESSATPYGDSGHSGTGASGLEVERSEENETETESSSSSAVEPVEPTGPTKSIFKSIPILIPKTQSSKSSNNSISGLLKRMFKLNRDSKTTKVFLVPKVFSRDKEIQEIKPKFAKVLRGNIPWLVSLPASDYFLMIADKNIPSTMLPLMAFRTAEGNEMERRIWGPTSSSGSSEAEEPSVFAGSSEPFEYENMELPDLQNQNVEEDDECSPSGQQLRESYFYRMLHESARVISRLSTAVGSGVRTLFVRARGRDNQVHPDSA